jgi:hypothetical protein
MGTPVSVKHIVKRIHKNRRDKTDWARVDALSDREIESAVKSDPDAAPILRQGVVPNRQVGPPRTQGAHLAANGSGSGGMV